MTSAFSSAGGVKFGPAEHNHIEANRVGISIGHRDTDNLITANTIRESKLNGILFRPEISPDFAGNRNRILKNIFADNATEGGAVIDVQGATECITISDNLFTDKREGTRRIAVLRGPDTKEILVEGSRLEGLDAGK